MEGSRRSQKILFVALLLCTVTNGITLPGTSYSILNVAIPFISLLIAATTYGRWTEIFRRQAGVIAVATLLMVWIGVSALFSERSDIALKYTLKYGAFYVAFLSLVLLFDRGSLRFYYRASYSVLLIFAVFGLVEFLHPGAAVFSLLRPHESLNLCYPRVASLLLWPNPFGVLMITGAVLGFVLLRRGWLSARTCWISMPLFLFTSTLSGSRNVWLVGAFAVLLLFLYRVIRFRDASLVSAVFAVCILCSPPAAERAGHRGTLLGMLLGREAESTKKTEWSESFDTMIRVPDGWSVWYQSEFPGLRRSGDSLELESAEGAALATTEPFRSLRNPEGPSEFIVTALVRTRSPNVRIGLFGSDGSRRLSEPCPPDGRPHRIEVRGGGSPSHVLLAVEPPGGSAVFDDVRVKVGAVDSPVTAPTAPGPETPVARAVNRLAGDRTRLRVWKIALSTFADNPVAGAGIRVMDHHLSVAEFGRKGVHAHNLYLNVLAELGSVGFVLFSGLLILALRKGRWRLPTVGLPLAILLSSQVVDCFIGDHTFICFALVFTAAAGNSEV